MTVRVSRRMFVAGGAMLGTGLLLNQYDSVLKIAQSFGISAVAAGNRFSLAVRAGEIFAWGDNTDGQCDFPRNLPRIYRVSAGWTHGLALSTSGDVFAWGGGLNRTPPPFVTIPRTLPPIVNVLATQNYSFLLADDLQTLYILGEEQNDRAFKVMNLPRKIQYMQLLFNGVVLFDDVGKVMYIYQNSDSILEEIEVLFRDSVIRMIATNGTAIGLTATGDLQYYVGVRNLKDDSVEDAPTQESINELEKIYAISQVNQISDIIPLPSRYPDGFYTLDQQGYLEYRGPALEGGQRVLTIPFPRSTTIRHIARSETHVLALTTESELVSWGFEGDADRGQYAIPRQLLD